ncbi:uncharacterized protein [Coffea arabica]|uniref:Uncharacterized protein isoform X2 n=1 Tax=Coffea arabica TaxID=13443 RepID=A0A6P6WZT5_COFAR|nr:uncharacterized protein LOC113736522 [Coffea arabica]XP_027119346.1 uncharacterized protein LOC113736522 [Coffea arabica]XP_027120196.1 uncharacterized protein LOC113737138 [Coffea arabica]XP_027120197.1 uncharacterized protein LOC113737138 [Coffea arabica]
MWRLFSKGMKFGDFLHRRHAILYSQEKIITEKHSVQFCFLGICPSSSQVQMIEDVVTPKPVHGITNFVPILNSKRNGTKKKKAMKRSKEGKYGSSSEHKEKMRRGISR